MTTSTVFRKKNQSLAVSAVDILAEENPMTLRQLYYRLISAGCLKNSQVEYKRLGQVMTRLRESKEVSRRWLVDHTRSTLKPSSWSGLADFGESVRDCYRKNFWASLPHHVEVFVEKDAVAGTIQPITEANDIALRVCRGYASVSFAGEIADFWRKIKKPIYAFYLGDFDPSGFDLERDLREKLQRYSGRDIFHIEDQRKEDMEWWRKGIESAGGILWQRIGVVESDFEAHNLIHLPVKESDNRAAKFIDRYGEHCAEIDAIPPTDLRRRVEEAIDSHIDVDEWNRLRAVEEAEQATIDQVVASLSGKST